MGEPSDKGHTDARKKMEEKMALRAKRAAEIREAEALHAKPPEPSRTSCVFPSLGHFGIGIQPWKLKKLWIYYHSIQWRINSLIVLFFIGSFYHHLLKLNPNALGCTS